MHNHQRRRSGNTSMTDVRRSVTATEPSKPRRPALSRKHTPQKLGKSHHQREREMGTLDAWDDEHESFPQFCMTCEKQFMPYDDKYLFCSERCRKIDQNKPSPPVYSANNYNMFTTNTGSTPFLSDSTPEPRDIIPRAAPSRPSSMHLTGASDSPPASPGTIATQHSSALAALRSLNIRPPSPSSPSESSGLANLWPFGRSSTTTSPSNSYTRPSAGFFSSTYDTGYVSGSGYDENRPLPSRSASIRPRSYGLMSPAKEKR